ncbi:hypothetical protein GCM10010406_49300 [Streptomyces thermolineatus]|uniref:Inner membrane protein YgaP-like transmembrane domain-containing protein n=1 Tax=Streptomyces thermolineatus TaxID=44033 RepID=A0ABN3MSA5_9ACTN
MNARHATLHAPHRRSTNIVRTERVARLVAGLVVIALGIVLLTAAGSVLSVVLGAVVVLVGIVLTATGGLGHCPLYQKLGYTPPSLRGHH